MQIVLWDRVFKGPREWLLGKLNPKGLPLNHPDRSYLSYLLECPWCMSVWIGAAIALGLANEATDTPTLWVLAVLAISLAAVVIDRLIDVYASDEAAAARQAATDGGTAPAPIPAAVATAFDDLPPGMPEPHEPHGG